MSSRKCRAQGGPSECTNPRCPGKNSERTQLSKKMSYVLRHNPEAVNLELDEEGWADLNSLSQKLNTTPKFVQAIVQLDSKQRFTVQEGKIRAAQGHSIPVKISYQEKTPPETLYHGTQENNLISIKEQGLKGMSRQYVHLSADQRTAEIVAARRKGKIVILQLDTAAFIAAGHKLYQAENGVWLTSNVPSSFITF